MKYVYRFLVGRFLLFDNLKNFDGSSPPNYITCVRAAGRVTSYSALQ
jgi:hypothetical protein